MCIDCSALELWKWAGKLTQCWWSLGCSLWGCTWKGHLATQISRHCLEAFGYTTFRQGQSTPFKGTWYAISPPSQKADLTSAVQIVQSSFILGNVLWATAGFFFGSLLCRTLVCKVFKPWHLICISWVAARAQSCVLPASYDPVLNEDMPILHLE